MPKANWVLHELQAWIMENGPSFLNPMSTARNKTGAGHEKSCKLVWWPWIQRKLQQLWQIQSYLVIFLFGHCKHDSAEAKEVFVAFILLTSSLKEARFIRYDII